KVAETALAEGGRARPGVQRAVEPLGEVELLGIGEGLVAENEDGMLVHPGSDARQRLAIPHVPEIDRADLGREVSVELPEGQIHVAFPPGEGRPVPGPVTGARPAGRSAPASASFPRWRPRDAR